MSTRDQVVDLPVCGCGAVAYIHHRACPLIQAVEDLLAAAEARVADLEAKARDLLDAMTRFGPDDSGQLWDAAQALRALVGDETPGTGERA